MGWKNMSGWLKGGIIGFILILCIVLINGSFSGAITPIHSFFDNLYRVLSTPMNALFESDEGGFNILIYSLIFYFIIGAIVGLIISKLKSKKSAK